jgi:hypothetical protein
VVGRRGFFADWIAAVRGTLAVRREKGKARVGLMAGGVVLTLAFLGLFVLGIRAEIVDSGDPGDAEVGAAGSDVPGLAGAGSTSSSDTAGDGTTTDDPGGTGSGTTAGGTGTTGADGADGSTSSTGVLGSGGSGSGQVETPGGGGSGGTSLITTTTSSTTSTTQPPGSSTPTTAPPGDPGLVGGLLDILGLGD